MSTKTIAVLFVALISVFFCSCSAARYANSSQLPATAPIAINPLEAAPTASATMKRSATAQLSPSPDISNYDSSSFKAPYVAKSLDELVAFLKKNKDEKLKIGLSHFYTLNPKDNGIVVDYYAFSPDYRFVAVYAHSTSDISKEISFYWEYQESKWMKDSLDKHSNTHKELKYNGQSFYYKELNDAPVDKEDTGKHPPSVEVIWSTNNESFRLTFSNTGYSKKSVLSFIDSVTEVFVE
jgi:hypothetical protein